MTDSMPEVNTVTTVADCVLRDKIKVESDTKMEQASEHSTDATGNQANHANDETLNKTVSADENTLEKRRRKRKRPRQRKPKFKRQKLMSENTPTQKHTNNIVHKMSSSESEDDYCLNVSNLPKEWSYIEIKNYIDTECGPVDEIEFVRSKNKDVSDSIWLHFPTQDQCEKAKAILENSIVESKKLCVNMEVSHMDVDSEILADKEAEQLTQNTQWVTDVDILDEDPTGLYGLKPEFLQSLDITPPLERWICVTNFRCDKSELRDILELAGHVLMCAVFTVQEKYARVLYSHPLEAVQAVSMLDGQKFYGKRLKLVMERCPRGTTILPKGLDNIGLGLGINGQPLRNIAKQYKRYHTQKSSLVNPILFSSIHKNETNKPQYASNDLSEKVKEIELHMDSQKKSLKTKNIEDAIRFIVTFDKDDTNSDGSEHGDKKVNEIKTIMTATRKVTPAKMNTINKGVAKQTVPVRHIVSPVSVEINPNFINGATSMNVTNAQPGPPGITEYRPPGPILPRPVLGPHLGPAVRPGFPVAPNPGTIPRPNLAMGPRPLPGPVAGPVRGPGPIPGPMAGPVRGPGPMPGPVAGPVRGPGPAAFGPGPRPFMPNPMTPGPPRGPRPFGPQSMVNPNSTTVRLRNLPLDTTFPFLCTKLSDCGQVVSLQLTEPGSAVVTFINRPQAEKCFQIYNGLRANNCVIEVQFI